MKRRTDLAEGTRLSQTRKLYAAYVSGDVEKFSEEFEATAEDPAVAVFREAWLYSPNGAIASAIQVLLEGDKTSHVLLRSERLVGKRSVIALLGQGATE